MLWEPPARIFFFTSTPSLASSLVHTCSEKKKKGGKKTTPPPLFPFSSTVMNRELCKRWSNLRTRKLDGQSGGPTLACLKTSQAARLMVSKKVSICVSSMVITEPEIKTPHRRITQLTSNVDVNLQSLHQ